jgi:hypothetical protein
MRHVGGGKGWAIGCGYVANEWPNVAVLSSSHILAPVHHNGCQLMHSLLDSGW